MHPYLIEIGKFKLPAYGVFIALAFFSVSIVASKLAVKEGIKKDDILDLATWTLICGIIGARIFFVFEHFDYFSKRIVEIFLIWKGGLTFYGGLIGGIIGFVWFSRKKSLPIWKTLDTAAGALPLGQAIGRIGCLFAGCCYGKPCNLPWAIVFTDPHSLARISIPLHPTQIYHMLANLTVFIVLIISYKYKKFDGQITALYLMLYSLGRFTVEFFRGDPREFIGALSLPQWISIIMFISGVAIYKVRGSKR